MHQDIKNVLAMAVTVVECRKGDVSTEDGMFATTDLDAIIDLEATLCKAFDTVSDNVSMSEIGPKIIAL